MAALEYKIKAGFLYNFAKLTQWPSNTFATADAPIVVAVLGEDPFGAILDDVLRGKIVDQRKLVIRRSKRLEEVASSQILFIGASEQGQLPQVLRALENRSVLTVSEIPGFAEADGMIELVTVDQSVKLRVNLQAVQRAHLRLSSRLLTLAQPKEGR